MNAQNSWYAARCSRSLQILLCATVAMSCAETSNSSSCTLLPAQAVASATVLHASCSYTRCRHLQPRHALGDRGHTANSALTTIGSSFTQLTCCAVLLSTSCCCGPTASRAASLETADPLCKPRFSLAAALLLLLLVHRLALLQVQVTTCSLYTGEPLCRLCFGLGDGLAGCSCCCWSRQPPHTAAAKLPAAAFTLASHRAGSASAG